MDKRNNEGYLDMTAFLAVRNIERQKRKEEKSMSLYKIERGDIFYIFKQNDTVGSEQQSGRPAVIVSNDINNAKSDTVEVVYCTTKTKNDLPTHVVIRSTNQMSTVLCEQVTTVSKERLGDYAGHCAKEEMSQIDIAISISLGLDFNEPVQQPVNNENPKSVSAPPITQSAQPSLVADVEELIRSNAERDIYKELYERLLEKFMSR